MVRQQTLKRGYFISFEGGEGVGKSTQIRLLAEQLQNLGYKVRSVREPGGTKIGEAIRMITHDPENRQLDYRAEALLFAASRAQIVAEVYRPYLEKQFIVLADRYVDSSYVYQGFGRGLGYRQIKQVNDFATGNLMPDLTFFLSLDQKIGHSRRRASDKLDRLDQEDQEFYAAVDRGYHKLVREFKDRYVVIDANPDVQTIHQQIIKVTLQLLN